jgi:hypothetical protein
VIDVILFDLMIDLYDNFKKNELFLKKALQSQKNVLHLHPDFLMKIVKN